VPNRHPIDGEDIQGNLIEIRRYLETHIRSTGQDNGPERTSEPTDWDIYRHAEYADGRRPRFAATDLILIGLVLALVVLVVVLALY
jgi:hypothetical protein